jgi:hypothetical protein
MTARRFVRWSCAAVLVILFLAVFTYAAEPLVTAEPAEPPARGHVCISGVYPHLATFNSVVKNDGETYGSGGECGIGAIVPWAGKLWIITYSPHCPTGSTDKLFAVDEQLAFTQPEPGRADEVREIAKISQDFEVDDASVIMAEKGRRYRLPKGDARYDQPFATGWPRGIRECESERYLMNGYDRKRVALSHDTAADVTIAIEVNFDHTDWRLYQAIHVPAGQTVTHDFPAGFCAPWVRVTVDKPCRATATFTYE